METLQFYLLFNTNFMVHTIITLLLTFTLLLTLVFAGYLPNLSLIKKDWKTFYPTLGVGLFFLAVWSLLYYLFF
ncbi:hypothetical protein [Planobacterium oryzisoli]|uniref:Uncharacterized protein n=1 Tax=Planobacterium oryzisoli TaxID=2771435 RepID=A0A930YWI2_9FLAO|nr:hypothetical protein [Planobacterium oryzisoli]MBF5027589.1 hypothetical protein [Planobacterium oryzisoli]